MIDIRDDLADEEAQTATACAPPLEGIPLAAHHALVVPLHKRLFKSYATTPDGTKSLHLTFGEDEIVFDEPELFAFGEGLSAHPRFIAGDAVRWGAGYSWSKVRELLEQLIEAGLVEPTNSGACPHSTATRSDRSAGPVPSPLPKASCTTPRTWLDCESIMRELTGRSLDVGHLELVVPIYRVAHPALDAEQRQVGEANVFPGPLRLDIPTEWRVCQHAGSRFQDEQPMNVSSLRSMVTHWKPAMALLHRLRAAFMQRFAHTGAEWTIGDLQLLTSFVLAVPAYLLMKADERVPNGRLDPVLSALFRVTDGVRMVLHRMLYTDDQEPSRPAGAPIDAAEIYAYAERNTAFLSDHGVCAGPKGMIEQLLRVLVDGLPAEEETRVEFGDQVKTVFAEIDRALDYALLGMQTYAVVFSLWPGMARAYERMHTALDGHAWASMPRMAALRDVIERHTRWLRSATRIKNEPRRLVLEQAYAHLYAQCAAGFGERLDAGHALPARLAAPGSDRHAHTTIERLAAIAHADPDALSPAEGSALRQAAGILSDYLSLEQRVIELVAPLQSRINAVLGRTRPTRAIEGADLALHYRLVAFHLRADELADTDGRLPYLPDAIEQAWGSRTR